MPRRPLLAFAASETWSVAREEALDGVRNRRQLVIRGLVPILLFGVVLAVTLVTQGARFDRREGYVVAVEGDLAGAAEMFATMPEDRFVLEATDDAALDTALGATIGIEVPDRVDDRRARGEPVELIVHRSSGARSSVAATSLLVSALSDRHLEELRTTLENAGLEPAAGVADLVVYDVALTEEGTREITSGLVPALLVLQAAMFISGTATHLLARRSKGMFLAQLLLPISRWHLATAKGIGELVVGGIAAAPVLVVVVGFAGVVGWLRVGAGASVVFVGASLLTALVLGATATAIGLFIGTWSRSQEQVALLSLVGIVAFAMVASFFALAALPPVDAMALLPVAGLVHALRLLIAGDGSIVWFTVALVITSLTALGIVRLAARWFDAERLILRAAM